MSFTVKSPAFENEGMIPSKFTCDGLGVSPQLEWSGAPAGTKSFALISDDPDAPSGTWVHWVIFNIPAASAGLPENVERRETLGSGAIQGLNSSHKTGYAGPCPPSGVHRYYFKLYALDTVLILKAGATKQCLLDAMKGHILAETQTMGKYTRKK